MFSQVTTRYRKMAAILSLLIALFVPTASVAQSADDIIQHARNAYVKLGTYSDTGVVLNEYGSSSQDRHTFSSSFRRSPRAFVFDFHKQGGDRVVVWGDPDAFHSWWKTTGVQSDFPNPNNAPAINQSGYPTANSITKIPALLYGKDVLQSVFSNFVDTVLDGNEEVGSHKCFRIVGRASDFYGTGKEVNIHKLTVWIDADSFLVRKAREEWKALPGTRNITITTFEPEANPKLEDSKLRFTAPEAK